MLDTKTHAVFAVSKGEVMINKLVRIDMDTDFWYVTDCAS